MSIVGKWTFFYDWNFDSTYQQNTINFANDGTFQLFEEAGQWVQIADYVQFIYLPFSQPFNTVFSGNVITTGLTAYFRFQDLMNGIMTNLNYGEQGTWYATRAMTAETFLRNENANYAERLGASGKKKNVTGKEGQDAKAQKARWEKIKAGK